MGSYLNQDSIAFENARALFYVDKSECFSIFNQYINSEAKFICVSRPRRFGKSRMTSLMNAYYSKGCDSKDLFADLKIAQYPTFEKYLNKFDVIWFDLQNEIDCYNGDVNDIIDVISRNVIKELEVSFDIDLANSSLADALSTIYSKFKKQFIVIIDEWDAIFREQNHDVELEKNYIKFLKALFKGEAKSIKSIALAYITGILPIKKYNSQSALNNFDEYTMLNPGILAPYYGFTIDETKLLCDKYGIDLNTAKSWYDGYKIGDYEMLNPKSVISYIKFKKARCYWNNTAAIDAVTDIVNANYEGLKDDLIELLNGKKIDIVDFDNYNNDLTSIVDKDTAITYLIHLGYLAYDCEHSNIYIPNKEVRLALINGILKSRQGDLYELLKESRELLSNTINGDSDKVAAIIEKFHSSACSSLKYNNEDSLAFVVCYAYFACNENYLPFIREFPTGKGFADIVFIPKEGKWRSNPILFIELKWDKTAQTALNQIKERHYPEYFENSKGNIVLVGINYDKDSKKHTCKIELLDRS